MNHENEKHVEEGNPSYEVEQLVQEQGTALDYLSEVHAALCHNRESSRGIRQDPN